VTGRRFAGFETLQTLDMPQFTRLMVGLPHSRRLHRSAASPGLEKNVFLGAKRFSPACMARRRAASSSALGRGRPLPCHSRGCPCCRALILATFRAACDACLRALTSTAPDPPRRPLFLAWPLGSIAAAGNNPLANIGREDGGSGAVVRTPRQLSWPLVILCWVFVCSRGCVGRRCNTSLV